MQVKQITELTGVSPQTLNNWRHRKPKLYAAVVRGCEALLDDRSDIVRVVMDSKTVTITRPGKDPLRYEEVSG